MAAGPPKIEIPRWIQLVGLPLGLVLAWILAGVARHVVFLFVVAALLALLLNPLVRGLGRARIPRGFSVAIAKKDCSHPAQVTCIRRVSS